VSKEILISVDSRETRVAVVESGKLAELHVEREQRVTGSIYKAKVANVLAGMDAAFVDIGLDRNAFLYGGDILPESEEEGGSGRRDNSRRINIKDLLKERSELLVQAVKGPRGSKGARVSTRISLPGRYLVVMPDSDSTGVSRKVESDSERDRLKKIATRIKVPGLGLIVRTEAEGRTEEDLAGDLNMLVKMWEQIREKSARVHAPGLVHQDLSLIYKIMRDAFSSDVARLVIDSPVDYEKALELIDLMSPKMRSKVHLYEEDTPIFEKFGIESEINALLRRKVWLKSGGHLAIDSTEALTTIDVNTGKFVGSKSLSDTILKTNLDAVVEIARQLRLRDIGGMIVLDFIDMNDPKDRQKVITALEKELQKDREKAKICHISPLGLVEMTRKRTGETVTEATTCVCPHCQGRGRVESAETVSIRIERDLRRLASERDDEAFLVIANPEVVFYLVGDNGETVSDIERIIDRVVYVRADEELFIEKYQILPADAAQMQQQVSGIQPGTTINLEVVPAPFSSAPKAYGWADGYLVELSNGASSEGEHVNVRVDQVSRSLACAEVIE